MTQPETEKVKNDKKTCFMEGETQLSLLAFIKLQTNIRTAIYGVDSQADIISISTCVCIS